MKAGHWTYPLSFYRKLLMLNHLFVTCKKPIVSLINGVAIGGGAALSMRATFRVVTENAKLNSLENALQNITSSNVSTIATLIETFTEKANVKEDSPFKRLETINKCFSKGTVEDIILSLEKELENRKEKWITNTLSSMSLACPLSLKIFLKSIRKGRTQNIEQCFYHDYNIVSHAFRRTVSNDFYEGSRAKMFDKDNKPKWDPSKLELVSEEMVDQCFRKVNDEEWEYLQLPHRSNIIIPKL
ncbi:hypothetical protein Ahy_B05g074213 [Arachis hypogaea]|uniref:3-hydroxyisobutyryl-CoA hydrolase n=1 Tax=Arachis hypogaea TaxID=3818 RepID=A0A444YYA0_ARAHY|nr:hypothetical protein Ahy_B05g074213 [Arachis hypogaea]